MGSCEEPSVTDERGSAELPGEVEEARLPRLRVPLAFPGSHGAGVGSTMAWGAGEGTGVRTNRLGRAPRRMLGNPEGRGHCIGWQGVGGHGAGLLTCQQREQHEGESQLHGLGRRSSGLQLGAWPSLW